MSTGAATAVAPSTAPAVTSSSSSSSSSGTAAAAAAPTPTMPLDMLCARVEALAGTVHELKRRNEHLRRRVVFLERHLPRTAAGQAAASSAPAPAPALAGAASAGLRGGENEAGEGTVAAGTTQPNVLVDAVARKRKRSSLAGDDEPPLASSGNGDALAESAAGASVWPPVQVQVPAHDAFPSSTHTGFYEDVVLPLRSNTRQLKKMLSTPRGVIFRKTNSPQYSHVPVASPGMSKWCAHCRHSVTLPGPNRKKRQVGHRTTFMCSLCHLPLCMSRGRTCFFQYHFRAPNGRPSGTEAPEDSSNAKQHTVAPPASHPHTPTLASQSAAAAGHVSVSEEEAHASTPGAPAVNSMLPPTQHSVEVPTSLAYAANRDGRNGVAITAAVAAASAATAAVPSRGHERPNTAAAAAAAAAAAVGAVGAEGAASRSNRRVVNASSSGD